MTPSKRFRHIHFIGIGGSGMSSMGEVFSAWGFQVTGSDTQQSDTLEYLKTKGIGVQVGHKAENIGEAQVVVYSSAVPAGNPEMLEAHKRGIPVIRRAEMLGEALRGKYALAVAGTHGKTTTTTMLGNIWLQAGREPTLLAGGTTRQGNLSAVAGKSSICIFEADEFDRPFLAMRPTSAIIGNIDSDHLDCYGNLEAIQAAFLTFARSLPFHGLLVLNQDDPGIQTLLMQLSGSFPKVVTYGQSEKAGYRFTKVEGGLSGIRFNLVQYGQDLGMIQLRVLGLHNVYNALAAAALSLEEGRSFAEVKQGLESFPGVKRRMEFRGNKSGVVFYDDYAHHPTEVAAALQAARGLGQGRVVAIFQPHLYSRTQQLFQEFAEAFRACDLLFVTGIFPAREAPIPGVAGDWITKAAQGKILPADQVHYISDPNQINARVLPLLKAGDFVLTLGAGDIGHRGGQLMEAWS